MSLTFISSNSLTFDSWSVWNGTNMHIHTTWPKGCGYKHLNNRFGKALWNLMLQDTMTRFHLCGRPFSVLHDNVPVHKDSFIKKRFSEFDVKNLTGIHNALPINTFGMDWNSDCEPDLITQNWCLALTDGRVWMRANTLGHDKISSGKSSQKSGRTLKGLFELLEIKYQINTTHMILVLTGSINNSFSIHKE